MIGRKIFHYGNAPRFIPARLSPAAVNISYGLARMLGRFRHKLHLEISTDDLERLGALAKQRSILLPNHPRPNDWMVLYLLSARLKMPFHYMTAHEQFAGLRHLWIPGFGAYSIRRGGWGDVGGYRETLRLLQHRPCSLVIFPEGRCSFSSDSLLDFRPGAVKIGLRFLQRQALPPEQALLAVPIAIRYQYLEPIDGKLAARLARVELALGIAAAGNTVEERIAALTRLVVSRLEKRYGITGDRAAKPWQPRLADLCDRILDAAEQALDIHARPRPGIMQRACNIRQVLSVEGQRHGIDGKAAYQRAYYPTLLALILDSLGLCDPGQPLPQSAIVDLLYSLERIVYRIPDPVPLTRRKAIVQVGDSIDLRQWAVTCRENRRGIAGKLTRRLQQEVQLKLSTQYPARGTDGGFDSSADARARRGAADPVSHG